MELIEKDVLAKLENRSLFAKKALEQFHLKNYTSLKDNILKEINTLLKDDDPYYKGLLYSILIRIYIKEKKYKKVVEHTNTILEFSGMVLYEYCGKLSPFATDVIKKVISCYDILIKEKDIPSMWGKARILHFMNKWKDAHLLYDKALNIDPNNCLLLRMYGRLYEEECNYSKALDLYYRIKDFDDNNPIECFIANIYLKLLNFDNGIKILNKALDRNPNNTIILFRLFNFYQQKGDFDKAQEYKEKLIVLSPYNLKYILYTSNLKDNNSYKLFNKLKKSLNMGFDYSPVNRFIGDYYLNKSKYEKAVDCYQNQLNVNPMYPPAYSNGYVALMALTYYLDNNQETIKFEEIRQKFISDMGKNIEYETVLCKECEYADKLLDEKINKFEHLKAQNNKNIGYYLSLCDLYKQNQDDEKLKKHIDGMIDVFPEALPPYIKLYNYYFCHQNYIEANNCLEKIIKIMNIRSEKIYYAKIISDLLLLNKFCLNPDDFEHNFISVKTNNKMIKILAMYYYNLSYKNHKYIDYAYLCAENLIFKKLDEDDWLILFIKSLICIVKGRIDEGHKVFNSIIKYYNNFSLIDMIQVCGDVFDICYLHDLFMECKNYKDKFINMYDFSNELRELFFYQTVLLYLLHINYIKSNQNIRNISHYTYLTTLKKLLDDEEPSLIRLSSLNSANDPKEGKILFDILSSDINDTNILNIINNSNMNNYCALQTSFTLLQDALTMFRLYGKTDNLEGTGVNLVFNRTFFNERIKPPTEDMKHIFPSKNEYNNPDETPIPQKQEEVISERELPLYYVLYYNKQENILVFNPFTIYNSSIIDLQKETKWNVINQDEKELKLDNQDQYLDNIGFVFRKMKKIWENLDKTDYSIAKEILLNINYLIKDIAFFDEKELRMITIYNLDNEDIKHDSEKFTLYKGYMTLLGYKRYEKKNYLNKIILGPKVKQKESVKEYLINHLEKLGLRNVPVLYSEAPLA